MRFVYKVGIITLFATFFLMSHNAFAVDTTIDISNYEVIRSTSTPKINCKFNNSSLDATNVGICGGFVTSSPALVQLQRLYSYDSYSFQPGDIIEYDVFVYGESPNFEQGSGTGVGFLMKNATMSDYPFRVLSIKQNLHDDMIDLGGFIENNNFVPADTNRWYYTTYHYELIYVGPSNGSYQLGWTSGYSTLFEYTLNYYFFRIENFIQYRPGDETQVNKEQREATENAVQESEDTAEENSSSGQTTNLIGAFQSFVTALTSLNATNCNVTLAWPSSLGGNMQVNICQNKDYAGNIISVFGSLTLIVFYIPFSLKILSMIYNEIRSFTNG